MNNYFSPRVMVGAAIVGIVGAAGVFIYEQMYAEKRRAMLVREVARLDIQVTTMRSELEALRELQKDTHMRRVRQRKSAPKRRKPVKRSEKGDTADGAEQSYASDSECLTDYQSILDAEIDMDSEEFYDVPTDEDEDTLRESLRNGHAKGVNPLDEDSLDKGDTPKLPEKSVT